MVAPSKSLLLHYYPHLNSIVVLVPFADAVLLRLLPCCFVDTCCHHHYCLLELLPLYLLLSCRPFPGTILSSNPPLVTYITAISSFQNQAVDISTTSHPLTSIIHTTPHNHQKQFINATQRDDIITGNDPIYISR